MVVAPTKSRLVAAVAPSHTDAQNKIKTAAKQRYLKAKKNRRKNRAATANTQTQNRKRTPVPQIPDDGPTHSASSSSESERVASPEPPRKRRRVSKVPVQQPATSSGPASSSDSSSEDDADARDAEMLDAKRSPSPPSALPAFPLPTQPAPPSAETLQRQGVDSALLGAARVDPRTTLDLDALPPGTLSERTKKRLRELGIRELFAVQTALVPHLLAPPQHALYLPYNPPRDVCASAPTGSGKTLAYVVPLVELLSSRVVTRLRALIVLPTRDLVTQVREVFEAVAKGTGLKVASATGAQSFAHEQAQLVDQSESSRQGGSSKVDVLICTPGRLIDHLDGTPNFTLQHLRFLVIDEADRLLTQSFQDWLARVLAAITPTSATMLSQDAVAPACLPLDPRLLSGPGADSPARSSCQKVLLSATLTRDPGRLAALGLYRPQYFVVASGTEQTAAVEEVIGAIPEALEERMVVCEGADKPLVLAWVLRGLGDTQALVFCKSVEAATRLAALLADLVGTRVAAYSSDAPRALLDAFRARKLDVLVCSDLVARGLDVPSVGAVLNYDAPVDARKYVHRIGRTARAGKGGDAWTMLEPQEARWFKTMLAEMGAGREGKVKKVRVGEKELAPLRPAYEDALKKLAETYGR